MIQVREHQPTAARQPSSPSRPEPRAGADQWQKTIDELNRMRTLEQDWDGQGALPPDPGNVDHALEWVQRMTAVAEAIPPSRVVPGVAGEVLLVWQDESAYLEAEITAPDRIEWMLSRQSQPPEHWTSETAAEVVTSV